MDRLTRIGRRPIAIAAAVATTVATIGAGPNPVGATHTTVTAVRGSAFGYHADNITLFGGAQADTGPTPTVALAANASNSPQSATAPTGRVAYGPAVLFTSDQISVSTSGSLGTTGSVTTSTSIQNVNKAATQPDTGSEILTATTLASTCTASTAGASGSTTITGGVLQVESGWNDGDATYPETAANAGGTDEHDAVFVNLASSPVAGTSHAGHIHISGGSRDDFTVVLNEQVTSADGTLTVTAVHERLGTTPASTLKGDLFLGQSVCDVTTAAGSNVAPVAANDAYNTAYNTALSVPAPGVLANDTDADGEALTAGMYTQPANGTVAGNMNGSFTYTPNAGFSGNDTFTYMAHDTHGAMSNVATVTITVGPPPPADLAVGDITGLPDPVAPRGTVTYTIPVTNLGPSNATGVSLLSTLSGVRGASVASATSSDGGTCTVLKGKTRGVRCDLGTLANGATDTVTIMVTAPRKTGIFTLTSTVSSTGDTNAANNTASEDTTVQ